MPNRYQLALGKKPKKEKRRPVEKTKEPVSYDHWSDPTSEPEPTARVIEIPRRIRGRPAITRANAINIVWAENITAEDLNRLREQIDMAMIDPDYVVMTNYAVNWNRIDLR